MSLNIDRKIYMTVMAAGLAAGTYVGSEAAPRKAADIPPSPYGYLPPTVTYYPGSEVSFNQPSIESYPLRKGEIAVIQSQDFTAGGQHFTENGDPNKTQVVILGAATDASSFEVETSNNAFTWMAKESSTQVDNLPGFQKDLHDAGMTQIVTSGAFNPGSCTTEGCQVVDLYTGLVSQDTQGNPVVNNLTHMECIKDKCMTRILLADIRRDPNPIAPEPNLPLVPDTNSGYFHIPANGYYSEGPNTIVIGDVQVNGFRTYFNKPVLRTQEVLVSDADQSRIYAPSAADVLHNLSGTNRDQVLQQIILQAKSNGCGSQCDDVRVWYGTNQGLTYKIY